MESRRDSRMGQAGEIYKPPRGVHLSFFCRSSVDHLHPHISSQPNYGPRVPSHISPSLKDLSLLWPISLIRFIRSIELPHPTHRKPYSSRALLRPAKMVALSSFTSFLTLAMGLLFATLTIAVPTPVGMYKSISGQQQQHDEYALYLISCHPSSSFLFSHFVVLSG